MEVYKCLDDIITKIERQEQIILKARLHLGSLAIIDLHKYKYNSRLDGAEVLKMLFGISDSNPFGNFKMEVDENGYITILRELRICQRDWLLFNIFIVVIISEVDADFDLKNKQLLDDAGYKCI